MSKEIEFSYNNLKSCYTAKFLNNHRVFETKNLTDVEHDGLSAIIDFACIPLVVDAERIYNDIDSLFFDTENEGQETNFEIILKDLINQP